ncbi:uncharacterized protein EAF01_004496 [Botrytis porri]|uniref:Uncharacterized protein n=1 Tax=Botrytis porri TaxID=87229 RepID=A0A4Z1KVW1_9HELO|nr:uncharacterized protein EAF01_004496 [Botrytis porri]KAF7908741.1 hypothetical protein EAF01_004496 [Botrytis porri]TGO88651.1 hypothetical protein BPOR_0149g00050 [Botrytis porri]
MSIQQLSRFLNDQNEFRRQVQGRSQAVFLQYDYSESQQAFKDKFPSCSVSALGGLKDWEWFIDEKSKPNIRPSFYNQRLHIPMGPIPAPATRIEQYESEVPITVLGFLYTLSFEELNALAQEQCLLDRQQFYVPVLIQSRSINGFETRMIMATIFVDMATTRGGSIDLTNESTNLKWVTAIKRMEVIGMPNWYVTTIKAKLRGWDKRVEPLLVRLNPDPTTDPQAAQRQAALTSNARLKQQQQEADHQGRQKQKKAPSRPMITISQRQRDFMLQQILNHGMISSEAMLKLTESQKTYMVDTYLRRQQKAIYVRDKAEKKRLKEASEVSALMIGIPGQQRCANAPGQQTNPREEAILDDVLRKQKDAAREQDSRGSSRMPPPSQPARRYSQSSPGKGQAQSQAQNGNSRPPPQLNYPQNPNNLKRQASNSIANAIGTPGAKRQNTGNTGGEKGGSQNSNRNNGETKDQASNPNAKNNSSVAQEPKPKTRGRPRKSRAKAPPAGDPSNLNQDGQNYQVARTNMGSGGKVRTNANAKGNAMSGGQAQAALGNLNRVENGNGVGNAYSNGNLNTLNRSQALPHVEQAAKMVDYFQPKANGEKAGDGSLQ